MAPMKAKFADNEKLLCYHGPLLYEAKCVKSKKDGNSFSYFIHFSFPVILFLFHVILAFS